MNDLKDKIAIVTGGARGIGRGIALAMAREGATIVIADIDDSTFDDIQKDLNEFGGKCVYNYLDVRDYDSMSNLVESVVSKFGKIDILVNNAGVSAGKSLLDLSREEVLRVFETNLIGPFFLTQAVVGVMIEKKIAGNILFTSSTHSQVTMLRPAYSSSKAAIEMFVKDAALELAEYGIRVNAVAPGAIDIWNMEDRSSEHVPTGYLGTPADIGNAMVFLASEKSGYITGQTIVVDGAFSLAHMHFWKQKGKL
jgi:NAD(P)-dependent dehydrogenase (short-subunit alcohol dehydrogenase family)